MFGDVSRYLRMREKAGNLPEVEVTEEEFVNLLMQEGVTEKEARFQAHMAKEMGAAARIGKQMVKVRV